MFSSLLKGIQHRSLYCSLGLSIIFILLGFMGYLQHSRMLLVLGLLGNASTILMIILLIRQTIARPLKQLAAKGQVLAAKDSVSFSDGLAALAHGDLTSRIKLQSGLASIAAFSEVNQLVEVINTIVRNMEESAKDFNAVTDEPCQRLFYVGADAYLEGRKCGDAIGQVLNGRGQVLVIVSHLSQVSMMVRRKGFESMLHEKYPGIKIVDTVEDQGGPVRAYTLTRELLKRYLHLDGIYVANGGGPPGVARAVEEAGLAGRIKIVCHDLVDETMRYLANGVITATLSQDPFAQGHDPVIHLFNHLVTGWRPDTPRLLTAMELVTRENYQQYWQPGRGIIESEAVAKRRPKPIRPADKPIKIAVLGKEESAFWDPVHAGVLAAGNELRAYNATVEWMNPEADKASRVDVRGPLIEDLVAGRYDGIVTDIFDRELIPYINHAVSAGVPVATFNGEPNSLRGLMAMISGHAQLLTGVSQKLAIVAKQTSDATQQIADTVHQIAKTSNSGAAAVSDANTRIHNIAGSVDAIVQGTREQARATESVSSATHQISNVVETTTRSIQNVTAAASQFVDLAQQGAEAIRQTLYQMKNLESAVADSAETIRQMSIYSQQIGDIILTIGDIAKQTNLLALNAAIEASRAGEHGRGFAIVADEVRRLAEKSDAATKKIATIIHTIQESIAGASSSMEVATQRVQEGSALASHTGHALEQLLSSAISTQEQTETVVRANSAVSLEIENLLNAIKSVSAVIERNLAATEEVTTNIEQTLATIDDVAAVSVQNSAATEQVSATTEEVSAQAADVGRAATALVAIAAELHGATNMFKIN